MDSIGIWGGRDFSCDCSREVETWAGRSTPRKTCLRTQKREGWWGWRVREDTKLFELPKLRVGYLVLVQLLPLRSFASVTPRLRTTLQSRIGFRPKTFTRRCVSNSVKKQTSPSTAHGDLRKRHTSGTGDTHSRLVLPPTRATEKPSLRTLVSKNKCSTEHDCFVG